MLYDWRSGTCKRVARSYDAATGEEVRYVFSYDTETHRVGRFVTIPGTGELLIMRFVEGSVPVETWETRELRVEWADECDTPIVVEGQP